MLRMSSRILSVNVEVAGYSETRARLYRVTWSLVLGGSNLEEFSSARHGPMCPSCMSFFMFEAPFSRHPFPSHLSGSSLPEAGISSHLLLYHTVLASLSCSLSLINNVSTKDTRQANLFRVPAARLCVGVDQWVFCLLAEWSCCCPASSLSVAQGHRRYGEKQSEDLFIAPWTAGGIQNHPGYCGILRELTSLKRRPIRRYESAAIRMARKGRVLCRRCQQPHYQGCWSASRNAAVQPSSARFDHDHATESNPRSSGYLRSTISSSTRAIVAM